MADLLYTIKEVARLTGVSVATLRKWEERYQLVAPARLPNGYRGYTSRDVAVLRWVGERVRGGALISVVGGEARRRLAEGWPPGKPPTAGGQQSTPGAESDAKQSTPGAESDAKQSTPGAESDAKRSTPGAVAAALLAELLRLDFDAAARRLDRVLMADYAAQTALLDVVAPAMQGVGEAWARGELSAFAEHLISVMVRDRLGALRRSLPPASGPMVLTGCVPGEHHELGSLMLGVLAQARGFRVVHLGGSPSPDGLCEAVQHLRPFAVCLSATVRSTLALAVPDLIRLAEGARRQEPPPLLLVGGQAVLQGATLPEAPAVQLLPGGAPAALAALGLLAVSVP